MIAFATAEDLATRLQRDLSAKDTATAEFLLDMASAAIRNYTHQTLSLVEDDTLTLDPPSGRTIFLPELPVVSVASVAVAGSILVENVDYFVYPGQEGMIRLQRHPGTTPRSVVVVHSHGLVPIPDDIRGVCVDAAARSMGNPQGVAEEQTSMGPASVRLSFPVSVPRLHTMLSDGEKEVLGHYRPMVSA